MKTTLNKIRAHFPCYDGWRRLLAHLVKTQPDDELLPITTILDSNGIRDALWCLRAVSDHDREMRLYGVWCARRVEHLMTDPRSRSALDVAERYARGRATDAELFAAREAAREAVPEAQVEWKAARAAAATTSKAGDAAAEAAAIASTWAAASEAARRAEHSAQADELRRVCTEIEAGRDPYPEEDGR